MDFSKLPRLSQSKGQEASAPTPAAPELPEAKRVPSQPVPYNTERASAMSEVGSIWLSLIISMVVMMMGWGSAKWATATLLGQPYDTGVTWQTGTRAGQSVAYWDLMGHQALSESALFLFGLACLLEAAAMAAS